MKALLRERAVVGCVVKASFVLPTPTASPCRLPLASRCRCRGTARGPLPAHAHADPSLRPTAADDA